MLLRRRHILLFLQTLLFLLVFVACSDDRFDASRGDEYLKKGTPGYLTFRVLFDKDPDIHRAPAPNDGNTSGEFVTDQETEYANGGSYLLLFSGEQKLLDVMKLGLDKDNTYDNNNYIEVKYKGAVYPLEREDTIKWPTYCLLVMNSNEQITQKLDNLKKNENSEMKDALSIIFDTNQDDPRNIGFSDASHSYFTMTNSVYKNRQDSLINAAKIDPTKITPNPNDTNNIMTIHVERMVAKCSLKLPQKEEKDNVIFPLDLDDARATPLVFFKGINDSTASLSFVEVRNWRVKVTGWGINALETESHLFKQIGFGLLHNEPEFFRTNWSNDPHYATDWSGTPLVYPWQYRRSIDDPERRYYEDRDNNNLLRNYSYETLELGDSVFDKIIYVPENTYDYNTVKQAGHDSREELLAGTHLLIGAKLQISTEISDKDPEGWREYDLYRDRNGLYYYNVKDCFVSLVHSFNHLLTSQNVMKFTLYDWKDGGKIGHTDGYKTINPDSLVAKTEGTYMLCLKKQDPAEYDILDDTKLAEILLMTDSAFTAQYGILKLDVATLRSGDGRCLPWIINSIKDETLVIRKIKEVDGEKIIDSEPNAHKIPVHKMGKNKSGATIATGDPLWEELNENHIKSLLYEWLGAIDHFNNGKMYYAHGINNPSSEWDKTERYGVVRNNWYQFNIKDIKSIGIPIDNPTQPIVPEKISNKDQINVTVKIIGWHEVTTEVDLFN